MLVDQAICFTASSGLFTRHSLYTYLFWHSLFFKSGLTSQSAHYLVLLLFHYEQRNLKNRKTTTNLDTDHSVLYTELKDAAILDQIYKLTRKKKISQSLIQIHCLIWKVWALHLFIFLIYL